jgi:hypothetical protein
MMDHGGGRGERLRNRRRESRLLGCIFFYIAEAGRWCDNGLGTNEAKEIRRFTSRLNTD